MSGEIKLNVLTLNCWGIPIFSKNRIERLAAVSEELSTDKYDLVCLQELWSFPDFKKLQKGTKHILPHSHYFFSGVLGSGICIFSKYPIEDVFFHQWSLNGYVHKVQHGDWFGGKGIGLCKVTCGGFRINLFSLHLHAEYDKVCDEYLVHRVLQAFELSQVVSLCAAAADLTIVAGDFNTESGSVAQRIICHNGHLCDTFVEAPCSDTEAIVGTCGVSQNSYSDKASDNPERIDYVMYRVGHGVQVEVLSYQHPLPDRVPGKSFSYSDHEAVMVSVRAVKSSKLMISEEPILDKAAHIESLREGVDICSKALPKLLVARLWYQSICFLSLVLLLTLHSWEVPFKSCKLVSFVYMLATVALGLILGYSITMATLWSYGEENSILAGKRAMEVILTKLMAEQLENGGNAKSEDLPCQ